MASSVDRSSSSNAIVLTESDVPGASLLGQKPEELSNSELKFWLKCRGDPGKGLKTKAELVKRVRDYIKQAKTRRSWIQTHTKYTVENAEKMPVFMWVEINSFVMKSGKAIANKDHHTVPTGLIKARHFLDDEYLEEIECASDSKHFFFKGKCCHSFRKSESPHNLKVYLCIVTGEVKSACCSCVAGKVGFFNHVLAFMFKMCKFTLYNCTSAKELSEEQDQQSSLACTSQLQQWQRKGGGKNIGPQPIMEVEVIKTKIDESRSRSGLKSLLYDARMKTTHNEAKEEEFKRKLKIMNPNNGLSQMASEQGVATNDNGYKETRFGKCQVGSFLSYQVALTESNFEATASVNCIPRVQLTSNQTLLYPRFPLRNIEEMVVPGNLSEDEKQLLHTIQIEEEKINEIERQTRDQAESDKWREERKFRFTASKFHLISKHQRNHKNFAETLINPTSVTSKYLEHGKKI